jgi:hypothetical protein
LDYLCSRILFPSTIATITGGIAIAGAMAGGIAGGIASAIAAIVNSLFLGCESAAPLRGVG